MANIKQLRQTADQVQTLLDKIGPNEQKITTLQNQLAGTEQSIENLNGQIQDSKNKITTLQNQLKGKVESELNNKINSNTSNIADLKTKVEKNAKDIKNINESSIEIQGTLNKVPVNEQNIASKQDRLISGFNYKTINGNSLLGKGNISIPNIKRLHDDSFKFNSGDKIVCIGDSTTAGVGASSEETKYISVLGKLAGVPTVNLGISGSTLCIGGSRGSNFNALSNAALKSTSSNKTVVTIMIGLNDFDLANDGTNTVPTVGNQKQYTLGSPDSEDPLTIYGALYK